MHEEAGPKGRSARRTVDLTASMPWIPSRVSVSGMLFVILTNLGSLEQPDRII